MPKTGKTLVKTNHHLGSGPKKETINLSVRDPVSNDDTSEKTSVYNEQQTEKTDDSKTLTKPVPTRKVSSLKYVS